MSLQVLEPVSVKFVQHSPWYSVFVYAVAPTSGGWVEGGRSAAPVSRCMLCIRHISILHVYT